MKILNNIVELGVPLARQHWLKRKYKTESTEQNQYTQWEKDFILSPNPEPERFCDYLEMIIQYGFLTMFAAAFPLAALFALINNVIEIRVDSYKSMTEYRRPIPKNASNIEPWYTILEVKFKAHNFLTINALLFRYYLD